MQIFLIGSLSYNAVKREKSSQFLLKDDRLKSKSNRFWLLIRDSIRTHKFSYIKSFPYTIPVNFLLWSHHEDDGIIDPGLMTNINKNLLFRFSVRKFKMTVEEKQIDYKGCERAYLPSVKIGLYSDEGFERMVPIYTNSNDYSGLLSKVLFDNNKEERERQHVFFSFNHPRVPQVPSIKIFNMIVEFYSGQFSKNCKDFNKYIAGDEIRKYMFDALRTVRMTYSRHVYDLVKAFLPNDLNNVVLDYLSFTSRQLLWFVRVLFCSTYCMSTLLKVLYPIKSTDLNKIHSQNLAKQIVVNSHDSYTHFTPEDSLDALDWHNVNFLILPYLDSTIVGSCGFLDFDSLSDDDDSQ